MSIEGLPKYLKVTELAKLMDMTDRHVQNYAQQGIIPKSERGKYPTLPCLHAYIRDMRTKLIERSTGPDHNPGAGGSMTDVKLRLTKAQAEKAELEVEVKKRSLIESLEAEQAWGVVVSNTRAKLLSIPSKAAPLLVACNTILEAQDLLEKLIHEVLEELANPILGSEFDDEEEDLFESVDENPESGM